MTHATATSTPTTRAASPADSNLRPPLRPRVGRSAPRPARRLADLAMAAALLSVAGCASGSASDSAVDTVGSSLAAPNVDEPVAAASTTAPSLPPLATDSAPASTQPVSSAPIDTTDGGFAAGRCDGDYSGSYSGDDAGEISARISDGTFVASFDSDVAGTSIDAVGTVDADGKIEGRVNTGATSTGQIDAVTCVMSGTWVNDGLIGTWQADPAAPPSASTVSADDGSAAPEAVIDSPCTGGADFRGAEFVSDDFDGDLRCADFSLSIHSQTTFAGAALDGATFNSASLAQVSFVDTSMRSVDLRGAELGQVEFVGVDLSGALTAGARNAQSDFIDTICPDGSKSDDNGGTCDLS